MPPYNASVKLWAQALLVCLLAGVAALTGVGLATGYVSWLVQGFVLLVVAAFLAGFTARDWLLPLALAVAGAGYLFGIFVFIALTFELGE